ncbi:hypothetical protein CR513_58625, partial [Mucuna pruriens]
MDPSEFGPLELVRLYCVSPHSAEQSREVSAKMISSQSLPKASRPVLRQVWLYLQPALFNTWGAMKRTFLENFFPASGIASIQKEICGISEQLLIQYFYEGLSMMDKSMIDAASGGALMDKMPAVVRHLISNMEGNTQQVGIRGPSQSRMVNEIGAASNQRLENQLTELTSLVRQLTV